MAGGKRLQKAKRLLKDLNVGISEPPEGSTTEELPEVVAARTWVNSNSVNETLGIDWVYHFQLAHSMGWQIRPEVYDIAVELDRVFPGTQHQPDAPQLRRLYLAAPDIVSYLREHFGVPPSVARKMKVKELLDLLRKQNSTPR